MALTIEEMKAIRQERGISVSKLSDYSGVPLGTLQKILNGETKNPRRATMDAIEKVLLQELKIGKSYLYAQRSVAPGPKHESGAPYYVASSTASDGQIDIYQIRQDLKEKGYAQNPFGFFGAEDFYALPEDMRVELIEGTFYDMSAPSVLHQELLMAISASLYAQIKGNEGNCKVLVAPANVRIRKDDRNMVQPDVMIVCDKDKISRKEILGSPDFVLEIISPSTKRKDMTTKLGLYADAGVREYWLLDPIEEKLLIYDLQNDHMIPQIMPLVGHQGLLIYQGGIQIDLTQLQEIIKEYDK